MKKANNTISVGFRGVLFDNFSILEQNLWGNTKSNTLTVFTLTRVYIYKNELKC